MGHGAVEGRTYRLHEIGTAFRFLRIFSAAALSVANIFGLVLHVCVFVAPTNFEASRVGGEQERPQGREEALLRVCGCFFAQKR